MSGKPAAAVATCACVIMRHNRLTKCANRAKKLGTLTYTDSAGEPKTARVGFCNWHANQIANGRTAQTRDPQLEPEYPYIVSGTWEPDPEPTP